jgi:isopropylmalate/homocitrate/citramalate synthase
MSEQLINLQGDQELTRISNDLDEISDDERRAEARDALLKESLRREMEEEEEDEDEYEEEEINEYDEDDEEEEASILKIKYL